jgi:hypothetical protein
MHNCSNTAAATDSVRACTSPSLQDFCVAQHVNLHLPDAATVIAVSHLSGSSLLLLLLLLLLMLMMMMMIIAIGSHICQVLCKPRIRHNADF